MTAAALRPTPAAAASPTMLPGDHWARRALLRLGDAGLIAGYAPGTLTLPADLSRFEAAALVIRAATGVGAQMQAHGEAVAAATQGRAVEVEPAAAVTDALAQLDRLITEFRSELADMGVRVEALHQLLTDLTRRVAALEDMNRRHQLSGYLQARFVSGQPTDPSTAFLVKDARLCVTGPVSPEAVYFLQIGADGPATIANRQVRVLDAYAQLALGPRTWVRAGQMKVQFGYELPLGGQVAEAPTPALVLRKMFFVYDTGAQVHHEFGGGWALDVAGVNGSGFDLDKANSVDVAARLTLTRPDWMAGLSAYDGSVTLDGLADLDRSAVSAFLHATPGRWVLRSEFMSGKGPVLANPAAGVHDFTGLIVLAGYHLDSRTRLYGKYDTFDPNRAAGADQQRTWALIVMHNLSPATRLRLAHEWLRGDVPGSDANTLTAEVQVRY